MASETKTKDDETKKMAANTAIVGAENPRDDDDDDDDRGGNERPPAERPSAAAAQPKAGFFAIYKKGQGYWTRMGTAIGVALLGALICWQIYDQVPKFFNDTAHGRRVALISDAVFLVLYSLLAWRVMNKPRSVDFLIATDSEMKKVNWTSRRELIGSTKVVILFMFAIAILLFALDLLFNTVFYYLHILQVPWWRQVFGTK